MTTGLTVDILREAFRRKGYTLVMEMRPFARCLKEVKSGLFDGMSDVVPRPGYLSSTLPVSVWTNAIWVRDDSLQRSFEGLASFKGKTVGFVKGYTYAPKVQTYDGWFRDWAKTDEMNINKLAKGRVDFIVGDIISTQHYLSITPHKIHVLEPPIESQREYVLFNVSRTFLLKDFNEGLKSVMDDGTADYFYMKKLNINFSHILRSAAGR
ncbi:MAG: transporter substrate-binding domain-containing protein [Chitinophagaceae bacterium]|nr:transporter substrate-binding domain-containing protein [Oligoflexus sp.]